MKINYKFNKDSEALTCKVESVDLIVYKINNEDTTPENCQEAIPLIRVFENSEDLKNYINHFNQEIEFIGSSSIDDVLLKDWLGEWEYNSKTVKYPIDNQEQGIKWAEDLVTEKVKSPKLNSNWKFKIN